MDNQLKPCPCGKVPKNLGIFDAGQGGKWAYANGDCCGEWHIEFRTQYHAIDTDKCYQLGVEAWNESPRAIPESKSVMRRKALQSKE